MLSVSVIMSADINECKVHPCHDDANCTNSPGSYNCDCLPGYTGNGLTCTGTYTFTLIAAAAVQSCHVLFDHNYHDSLLVSTLLVPMETRINALLSSSKIYNFAL